MNAPYPPFTCTYSPNIPELLQGLNCSLIITTYQAGKTIFISATGEELIQLPRSFDKAMGVALSGNKLALATQEEIVVFANSPKLAYSYPKKPDTYDALFIPRCVYYTGQMDIHDLAWGNAGLLAINTRFSCISLINDNFNFTPVWQPHFITSLIPEDCCHLNGIAMADGEPKYVTALGKTDSPQGWRAGKLTGGIIADVKSNEIILEGLAMPHSPRYYNGQLYALLSATGELILVDTENNNYRVVKKLSGFVRGMAFYGDYVFVGLSKIRKKSSAFGDLPIAKESAFSGIVILYLPTETIVGHIKYETSVEEIYDLQILPNTQRPSILSHRQDIHRLALSTPRDSYWAQKTPLGS